MANDNITSSYPGDSSLEPCFDEWITARSLGVSTALLRKRRRLGLEPHFIRIGRLVRYRESEIRKFLDKSAAPPGTDEISAPVLVSELSEATK